MITPSTTYSRPAGVDYYALPLISNSSLTGFAGCKVETLEFGQQLHAAILEPELYAPGIGHEKINEMVKSAKRNALLMLMLNDPTRHVEQEYFPVDESGVQCKLKCDLQTGPKKAPRVIADIKTTDAKTKEEFAQRAKEYGYIRQGAFYLDGTGAKKYIIFAISKTYPHPTFTFVLTSDEVAEGRAEYERLIAAKLNPVEPIF